MKPIRRPFHPCLHTCIRRHGARALGAAACTVLALAVLGNQRTTAADITWIGGNVDWVDGGSNLNWSPNDEPDSDDTAIFNTANTVNLGSNNSILALTMSGGISLDTNDFDLTVNGLVQLTGSGTDLTVGGSASTVSADSVAINTDASIIMQGGTISVVEETGFGTFNINTDGTLTGNGVINLNDAVAAGTTLMSLNGGVLTAASNISGDLFGSIASTLTINVADADARIDLDNGVSPTINVSRNDTLDINGISHDASDAFSGTLNLSEGSTIDMSAAWQTDNGTINANTNGIIIGSAGSAATIAGAAFTLGGGSINLDAIDSLRFSAPFTTTAGTIANAGLVIFNSATTVGAGTDFQMTGSEASLTVEAGAVVNIDDANFNADGDGLATNVITINSGGNLDLDLGVGADTSIGSTINLNGGELDVTTDSGTWIIDRSVTVGASTGTSQINSDTVTFSSATVAVGDAATLDINAPSTWPAGTSATVGAGATMRLDSAATLSGSAFTGAGGTLVLGSTSTVSANTTISTGILDWDGSGIGSLHTINDNIALTINSPVIDGDGDMDDPLTIGGGATLTVSGPASWTMLNTLTANTPDTGLATIGGTSRMILETATGILNANGDTTISAPVTFGASSVTNIAAPAILTVNGNALYSGGLITGAGRYDPPTGSNNQVTADSTISCTNFNFDRGNWTVDPGALLTVNVGDYDPDSAINAFNLAITLNSGSASVTSADAAFVMDGALNFNNTTGTAPVWTGEPLEIGNDAGVLDADLNVTGTGTSQINSAVTFQSDADVNVAAGSTLVLASTATFNSVNATENAEFTGTGTLVTGSTVNFAETTTVNLVGGTVDLDGTLSDNTANTVNVDAPVVINAASIDSFGNSGNLLGFANTIDIDSDTNTGLLTVNLDNPASEWTLNSVGVMNLTNDNTDDGVEHLLAGSAVNLNGTVNVTGDVRTNARVDIGASATVDIATAGQPFRLSGGDLSTPNTISGGTIQGPGLLGADTGSMLSGFGTIAADADIDFDGNSDLLADNGTLTVNSSIVDARNVGTADLDGTLNVPNAWSSAAVSTVLLQGGTLQGGALTLANINGMSGHGMVTAPVSNDTQINANIAGQTLLLNNTVNIWDGGAGSGKLIANAGILECQDNSIFLFDGTINALNAGTVFSNGFAFTLAPASTLGLASGGTYKSTNSTDIQGTVTVGAGADSTIEVQINRFLTFEATSSTTLNGNLRLVTNNGIIRAGATFAGAGALKIPSGSIVGPENTANVNVLIDNSGRLMVANFGTGRVDAKDFQQSASGVLEIDLNGTALANHDRLFIGGTAQIAGDLDLDLGGGYVPALGDTFNILSATGGVIGTFNPLVQPAGMPSGLIFEVTYTATLVQVKVVAASPFETWINTFGSLTDPADKTKGANPDGDDLNNLGEFALDGDPTSGVSSGKIVGKIAPVGGVDAMTLTIPVRSGAVLDVGDPLGGELVLKQAADVLTYRIQASDDLSAFTLDVTEVTGPDATAIQAGLPALNSGWGYRTFRSPGGVAGDSLEFMRAVISE